MTGNGPEDIAARFGVTPPVVRQRLKLAAVSPKLIALYRKGDMTLDCLMAFTVSDDHKQQEKVWKALPGHGGSDPDHIRDALTEEHIDADSKLAHFVGIEAYEAAGGAVLRDLFDDGNAGGSPTPPCSTDWPRKSSTKPPTRSRRRLEMGRDHSRPDMGNHQKFRHGQPRIRSADRRAAAGDRQADEGRQRDP